MSIKMDKKRQNKFKKLFAAYRKFLGKISVLKSRQTKILKEMTEKKDKQKADEILNSIKNK